MINESDYQAREWGVLPNYTGHCEIDSNIYDEMESHPESPGKSSRGTRNLLYSIILSMRPKTILEIGAHIGCASVVMGSALKANRFGSLVCLEPQEHYFNHLSYFIKKARLEDYIKPLRILSTDPSLKGQFNELIDIIFLDANHSYSHALKDIEIAYSLMAENGIIILDDVGRGHSANIDGEMRGGVRQALIDYCERHSDLKTIFLEHPFWLNPCGLAIVCKQVILS